MAAVSMWQVTRPNPMWFDHVLTACLLNSGAKCNKHDHSL
jgi:hypothetical protein